jgi:hypothetical protein
MNIEIRDASLEARIQKQLQATGSASVEEVLLRLIETQEEQDRWLLESREAINAKIRRSIDQLDRGEGIPEDQLDAYLGTCSRRKPQSILSKSGGTSRNKAAMKWQTESKLPSAGRSFSWRQIPALDIGAKI